MKSEHRHELAENDLSKLLSRWGAEFDKHANTVLSVLIVVALVAAGIMYWVRSSSATNSAGWTELSSASTAEQYINVAEMFPGTQVAEWATLRAADEFLQDGIRLSLTDRPASNERLQQAKESYESLLENTSVPPEIREQTLMGYAVTLETLSDGDTSKAIAAHEQLIEEFAQTRFRAFAEDRIKALKSGGAQNFYAWFHQLNPKPADLPAPQDRTDAANAIDPGGIGNLLQEIGGSGVPDLPPLQLGDGDAGDAPDDAGNPFAEQENKDNAAEEQGEASPDQTPDASTSEASGETSTEAEPELTSDDATSSQITPNETETKAEEGNPPESP